MTLSHGGSSAGGVIIGGTYGTGAYSAPSSGLIVEGNVGIGTTNPGYTLHLSKTVGGGTSGTAAGIRLSSYSPESYAAGIDAYQTNYADRLSLAFSTYGADGYKERVRIQYDGNVGIGTTTPGQVLHLYRATGGLFEQIQAEDSSVSGLSLKNAGPADWWLYTDSSKRFIVSDNSTSKFPFTIEQGASSNTFYINSSGNVGIGTTNPGAKLEVNGDIQITGKGKVVTIL